MEKPYSYAEHLTMQSRYAPDTEMALPDGRTFWVGGPLLDMVASIVEGPAILGDESVYAEWWMEGRIPPSMVAEFMEAGFVETHERDGMRYFTMSEHVQLIANSMIAAREFPDGEIVYGVRDPRTGRKTRISHPIPRIIGHN